MKELAYQRWVVNSARRSKVDRGYAIKLSHQTAVGIPDLLVSLPGFAPCLIECKWLGRVIPTFSRKISLTGKQRLELSRFNHANQDTGWVLVGGFIPPFYFHHLYHPHVTKAVGDYAACVKTKTQKDIIPLAQLFVMIGVRKL